MSKTVATDHVPTSLEVALRPHEHHCPMAAPPSPQLSPADEAEIIRQICGQPRELGFDAWTQQLIEDGVYVH